MRDSFSRSIDYLRLSVTELCDLRCAYCMPPEGVCKREHRDICSLEELEELAAACVALGVKKIRLTGGEPLVRRGIQGDGLEARGVDFQQGQVALQVLHLDDLRRVLLAAVERHLD